jgi:hypothetical protein
MTANSAQYANQQVDPSARLRDRSLQRRFATLASTRRGKMVEGPLTVDSIIYYANTDGGMSSHGRISRLRKEGVIKPDYILTCYNSMCYGKGK